MSKYVANRNVFNDDLKALEMPRGIIAKLNN